MKLTAARHLELVRAVALLDPQRHVVNQLSLETLFDVA